MNHSKHKKICRNEVIFLIVGILFAVIPKINHEKEALYKWQRIEANFIPLDVPMDKSLQKDIFMLTHSYELPFTLIMALIQQESHFQPDIVSDTKDWGLMQINEINHPALQKELGITNFLNPRQNIQAGIYMLDDLFEKYEKPALVLMAYNLGESGAKRLWKQKIYETKYSKNILKYQNDFQKYLEKKKK